MLVCQEPRVRTEVHAFTMGFALAERNERFIEEHIHVEVNGGFESFLLHPGAAIASEIDGTLGATDFSDFAHKTRSSHISLARVSKDANLLGLSSESTLSNLLHIY